MTLAKTLKNKRQLFHKAQFASILKSAKNCQKETELFNFNFIVNFVLLLAICKFSELV